MGVSEILTWRSGGGGRRETEGAWEKRKERAVEREGAEEIGMVWVCAAGGKGGGRPGEAIRPWPSFGKASPTSGKCRFGSSVNRQGFVYFWGMSRAKFKFLLPKLKVCRGVVSIHGPLGYEPNTLTTAPLGS